MNDQSTRCITSARDTRRRRNAAMLSALAIACTLGQASASTLATATLNAGTYLSVNPQDGNATEVGFDFTSDNTPVATAGSYALTDSTLNYQATAQADYGVLKVNARAGISRSGDPSGSDGPASASASADASFRDEWTISGRPAGSTGTLQLNFALSGSYDFHAVDTGIGSGLSLTVFSPYASAFDPVVYQSGATGTIGRIAQLAVQFTFGTPFAFLVDLNASATLNNLAGGGYDGQAAFLDLSHTALLEAIVVKDAEGNVVPFGLTTTSGAERFGSLAPVPLPAGLPLLGAALAALGAVARRPRR